MAKPSIYAVARGRACGLFTSWQECEKQIKGYPGARYKGFADVAAALAWLNGETNAATGAPQGSARRAPAAPRPPSASAGLAGPKPQAAPSSEAMRMPQDNWRARTSTSISKERAKPASKPS